ncbi:MAG TPA: tetratricopeptide repeat protein, partial [Roseiflexaceae bacterium]|nr:tetratricopeptide repeat protein [Roseiflexaceae bacterium]
KHIVTQEVAYASLTEEARAALHEQLATYLEQLAGDETDRYVDLLAYHYERSDNLAKKREYLRRAGEAAAARYANNVAIEYLSRALELAPEDDLAERYALLAARFQIDRLQRGDKATEEALPLMEELAEALGDDVRRAEVAFWQTSLGDVRSAEAQRVATKRAIALLEKTGSARALMMRAMELLRQQEYAGAKAAGLEALRRAREQGDQDLEGDVFGTLAWIAVYQGDHAGVRLYYEEELRLAREVGDRLSEGTVLHNLGWAATNQGDYAGARTYLDAALRLVHLVGNRLLESNTRIELGKLAYRLGDYTAMREHVETALRFARETGFRGAESEALFYLGVLACNQGDAAAGQAHFEQALRLAREAGEQGLEGLALWGQGNAALAQGKLNDASSAYTESLALPRDPGMQGSIMDCLAGLARVALAQGDAAAALRHAEAILAQSETGNLGGAYEPLHPELTCYQALRTNGDPRARAMLESAYQRLQEQAAKLLDEPTRRMFLENRPYHREILAAWVEERRTE